MRAGGPPETRERVSANLSSMTSFDFVRGRISDGAFPELKT
jgi:hypothetical protein